MNSFNVVHVHTLSDSVFLVGLQFSPLRVCYVSMTHSQLCSIRLFFSKQKTSREGKQNGDFFIFFKMYYMFLLN